MLEPISFPVNPFVVDAFGNLKAKIKCNMFVDQCCMIQLGHKTFTLKNVCHAAR